MLLDVLEKSKKKNPHSAATSVQVGESRMEKIQDSILHPILSLYFSLPLLLYLVLLQKVQC